MLNLPCRWSVVIRHTAGEQTLVVTASTARAAVAAAWAEAHQPSAVAHRRGAAITSRRLFLNAKPIPGTEQL
ncbi:hypothetical protein [Streptacidiphilus carbonis]|uniref:hypothetical protein n=1 Tax=Streptacidiphilus carbonis TaxID=105422 RepID=UPI0005A890F7|nr:hypothetical protein [Streptacidiphilus carbonis]